MLVSDMDEIACDALKSWLWSSVALVSSLDVRMISYDSPTMGRDRRNLLLQESVDVFEIVQAIVYEELEFGDDAELMAHAFAEFKSNGWDITVDVCHNLFAALRGEDAEIGAADAHVGTDVRFAHADEHAVHGFRLKEEYFAQLLL